MLKDVFNYGIKKVIIACGRTDLRVGLDGLVTLIRAKYKLNPLEEGTLFLFCGTKKDVIKGLIFEGDGFLLLTKRLTDGIYPWPATPDEARELSREQYDVLMNGFKVALLRRKLRSAKTPIGIKGS